MSEDDTPTSFDALAHEHNLSGRMRDLFRIFFRDGQTRACGRYARSFDLVAIEHNLTGDRLEQARKFAEAGEAIGRRQAAAMAQVVRPYHPALDKDTAPGEFR